MKHYDSFENIKYDTSLIGDEIWAFNKLDGQNLCVKYNARTKQFTDFGSRKCNVDESHEQFGEAVKFFKNNIAENLLPIIKSNSGKKGVFTGADELTFYFEWYGDKSFAGFHQECDEMHLALIDVNIKKKGYIEPKVFYDIFKDNPNIEIPLLVYKGKLDKDFINWVENYPVEEYINAYIEPCEKIKEGVVCRRSTLLKGQRMPKVKIKTKWWLDKVHEKFSQELWKDLE